jgi:O-antigen ligase
MFDISDYISNLKRILIFFLSIYLSYIIANLYLAIDIIIFIKVSIGIIVALLFLWLSCMMSIENLIVIIILFLPFPVFIHVGKDLGTTNIVMIYTIFSIYWVRKFLNKEPIFNDRPLFNIAMLILLFYIISFINTPPELYNRALRKTSILVSCILLFYLIVNNIKSERAISKIVDTIVIISFIEALIILAQLFFPKQSSFLQFFSPAGRRLISVTTEGKRLAGTFGFDYGASAVFFSICIFIQIFWVQILKDSSKRMLYFLCMATSFIAVISTGSRVGIVGLFGGILFMMIFYWKYFNFRNLIIVFSLFIILFFGTTTFLARYSPDVANLYDRFVKRKVDITQRSASWNYVMINVKKHPWIGNGVATSYKNRVSILGGRHYILGRKRYAPHNLLLACLQGIGILGTFWFVTFLGGVFWKSYISIVNSNDSEIKLISMILLGAFVVFLTTQIVTNFLRHSNLQQFVWAVMALLISASEIAKNKKSKELIIF